MDKSELPKSWKVKKLGEVCDKITKGGTPTTYGFAFVDEGINFVKVENIDNGRIDLRSIRNFISGEAHTYQGKSQLKEYDLLFSIAGTIGTTCLIKREYLPANTNQALAILRGYTQYILPSFLKFQLSSYISQITKSKARGGAMNNISLGDLKSLELIVPPFPEQERIVAKIEELFSELDAGVENLKTAQAQLKTYRQAVLKYAFEGKFTNDIIKEGGLPEGWKWERLENLGELGRGKSKHRPRNDKRLFGGKYPFIQTGEVKAAGYIIETFEKTYSDFGLTQSKLWKKGTLCITIAANIAETAFLGFDGCFPDSIVGFTANQILVIPKYVFYFFKANQSRLESFAPATAQKNINLKTLENLILPCCPLEEQQKIVKEIESRLSVCDKLEETINESLDQSETLRQSILKKAFEGELVPQESGETATIPKEEEKYMKLFV